MCARKAHGRCLRTVFPKNENMRKQRSGKDFVTANSHWFWAEYFQALLPLVVSHNAERYFVSGLRAVFLNVCQQHLLAQLQGLHPNVQPDSGAFHTQGCSCAPICCRSSRYMPHVTLRALCALQAAWSNARESNARCRAKKTTWIMTRSRDICSYRAAFSWRPASSRWPSTGWCIPTSSTITAHPHPTS